MNINREEIFGIGVVLVLLSIVAFILFFSTDSIGGPRKNMSVIVVDRSYTPETTNVGMAFTSNDGNSSMSQVVTSSPEKYTILIRCPDHHGKIESIDVSPETYASAKPDKQITIMRRYGWITGTEY